MDTGLKLIFAKMGPQELGKALKISRQAVAKWTRVPAERVVDVERATGIPREKLRPELYR